LLALRISRPARACAIYVKKKELGAHWGVFDRTSPTFELIEKPGCAGSRPWHTLDLAATPPGLVSTPQGGHSRDRQAPRALCRGTADPLPRLALAHLPGLLFARAFTAPIAYLRTSPPAMTPCRNPGPGNNSAPPPAPAARRPPNPRQAWNAAASGNGPGGRPPTAPCACTPSHSGGLHGTWARSEAL
jgi:hypothetical protein